MSTRESIETRLETWMKKDPFLNKLPASMTSNEVEHVLAYEKGAGSMVSIERFSGEKLDIYLKQQATVRDLRDMIQCYIDMDTKKDPLKTRRIHWKYVWRRYGLVSVKYHQTERCLILNLGSSTIDGLAFKKQQQYLDTSLDSLGLGDGDVLKFVPLRRHYASDGEYQRFSEKRPH